MAILRISKSSSSKSLVDRHGSISGQDSIWILLPGKPRTCVYFVLLLMLALFSFLSSAFPLGSRKVTFSVCQTLDLSQIVFGLFVCFSPALYHFTTTAKSTVHHSTQYLSPSRTATEAGAIILTSASASGFINSFIDLYSAIACFTDVH